MSFKKLMPFLVILIVLLALGLLKRGSKGTPSIESQVDLKALVPSDLSTDELARLELYAGAASEEKVVLEKDGETWVVRSHFDAPVNEETLTTYLEKLVALKGEYRAEAADDAQLADYSLKDDEAFHVQGYKAGAEKPVVDVLFGKAPDPRTVFVRNADEKTVYVEASNLRTDAGVMGDDLATAPEADTWLDKEILALDKESVTKIAMNTPDKAMTFEKREKEVPAPEAAPEGDEAAEETPAETPAVEYEWAMLVGEAAKTFKDVSLQNVLNKLKSFTATTIVDPAQKGDWGLETPGFTAVVSLGEGDEVVIEGGRPDLKGSGYVRIASNDKDVVYEVSSYNFEQLFPKGSELLDLPKWEVNKDAISSVTVTQPEGQVVLAKAGDGWKINSPATNLQVQQSAIDGLINGIATWTPVDYTPWPVRRRGLKDPMSVSPGMIRFWSWAAPTWRSFS